ncbi:phosphoribosyltransferase [Chryseosolibacter indicus]|uniref:Phosphoribosyltransferase n=1 Tax=Chryseosolibacter indicus TaxID=2782351 RepID=A0ABS5VK34_9BACT|nr:phosphoribosyltransferase family protein [Chryseosolibacter indicus]MBT1701800.1 phosphoribosyltransferase [Chryseosolibacter indicus]
MAERKVFVDRRDAGFEVGKLLESKYKDRNALVLGIPRGGVVVAYEVANVLNGELSVVVTKKLPHPLQKELAIGAAAEDGSVFMTSYGNDISLEIKRKVLAEQINEIKNRIQRFRRGKPLSEMRDRIVILVDDGIATGSTIVPAIKLCKSKKAAKVIVAAPVSAKHYVSEINSLADEVVIAVQPNSFHAVAQVYDDFHNLSDKEVIELLDNYGRKSMKQFIH